MTKSRQFNGLLVALILSFGPAVIAIPFMTMQSMFWYHRLHAPAWAPPDWLFGPVWTLLYILMAAAAWLIWRKNESAKVAVPLALFSVQLVLNAAWTPIFFGAGAIGLALIVLAALWCCILLCAIAFRRVSPVSFWLMCPYIAWVTFALALNAALWRLNP